MAFDNLPLIHIAPDLDSISPTSSTSKPHPSFLETNLTNHMSKPIYPPLEPSYMAPPSLEISNPPPSPRPPFRRFINVKLPKPAPPPPPPPPPRHPHLTLKNPKTKAISPSHSSWPPGPRYEEWHPTTIIFEYQHQRGFPISEKTKTLCRVFNRWIEENGSKVGEGMGEWLWKGHLKRVEWLCWYWAEGIRVRKVRMKAKEEEWVKEWERREKGYVREEERGNKLSDEEGEMIERLEIESGEKEVKVEIVHEENVKTESIKEEMTDGCQEEEMLGESFTDTTTWAAGVSEHDEWCRPLKRKRESDL